MVTRDCFVRSRLRGEIALGIFVVGDCCPRFYDVPNLVALRRHYEPEALCKLTQGRMATAGGGACKFAPLFREALRVPWSKRAKELKFPGPLHGPFMEPLWSAIVVSRVY